MSEKLSDYLQLELGCSDACPLREEAYQIKESDAPLCHLIFGLSTHIFQLLKELDGPIYLFETDVGMLKNFLENSRSQAIVIIENVSGLESHIKSYLFKSCTYFFLNELSRFTELYIALKINLQLRVFQHLHGLKDEINHCIAHHFLSFHPLLESHKDLFLGSPVVIVGAGPSLQKNLKLLKELQKSCFIFAALNAAPYLEKAEIEPDFYGIIDPRKSFELSSKVYETPIFFRSSALFSEAQKFKSRIFVGDDNQNVLLSFFESLFENPAVGLEAGYTVSNFLFHIAQVLGCGPIVLMGQDLAFLEGEKYSGVKASIPELLQFEGKDDQGNSVQTTKDFYLSKKWFESRVNDGVDYYNLSDGLEIEGFKTTFPQGLKKNLNKKLKKSLMAITCDLNRGQEKLSELFQKIERVEELKKSQIPERIKEILLESDLKEMKLFEYFEEIFTLFSYLNPLLHTTKSAFYYTLLSDLKGKVVPWILKQ